MTSGTQTRLDVAFPSSGDECRAWLFMPDAETPPLVILGHGLGGTREYGLEPFAQRFAEARIAALVFTYPHAGPGAARRTGAHPEQAPGVGPARRSARIRGDDDVAGLRTRLPRTDSAGGAVRERCRGAADQPRRALPPRAFGAQGQRADPV